MQDNDPMELISKVSALLYRFEQRCQAAEQQLQASAQDVKSVAQQLPGVLRQSADASLQTLPAQVIGMVKQGLERPVDDYEQRVHTAGKKLGDGAHVIDQQIQRSERVHRLLIWKVVGVTASCLALLLAGGLWLSIHYTQVIRDNQLSAQSLQIYNAADVVNCDGQLCAKVDLKGKRYGSKGDYLPIKMR